MHFEIVGEIEQIETIAVAVGFGTSCAFRNSMVRAGGESSRVLPLSALQPAEPVRQKSIGTRLTGLARRR